MKRITTRSNTFDFIEKSIKVHGSKYDYSKVEYKNNKIKVIILCKKHGAFEQRPDSHLRKKGCPKCCGLNRSQLEAIKILMEKHKSKYDYSKSIYNGFSNKIDIICKEHGIFSQEYRTHYMGHGCPKCCGKVKEWDKFILKLNEIHNLKYDYSLVPENSKMSDIVKIKCKQHGIFNQKLKFHLNGHGCQICSGRKFMDNKWTNKSNREDFIDKSIFVHGDRYDYSLIEYEDSITKVVILCKKHGAFRQRPSHHLMGSGCQVCNISKGETKIMEFLNSNNLEYLTQHSFGNCKNIKKLFFDFYLPEYKLCIEFDGIQHHIPIKFFGGNDGLKERKNNDKIKDQYCNNNNIDLLRISYLDIKNIDSILNAYLTSSKEASSTVLS